MYLGIDIRYELQIYISYKLYVLNRDYDVDRSLNLEAGSDKIIFTVFMKSQIKISPPDCLHLDMIPDPDKVLDQQEGLEGGGGLSRIFQPRRQISSRYYIFIIVSFCNVLVYNIIIYIMYIYNQFKSGRCPIHSICKKIRIVSKYLYQDENHECFSMKI